MVLVIGNRDERERQGVRRKLRDDRGRVLVGEDSERRCASVRDRRGARPAHGRLRRYARRRARSRPRASAGRPRVAGTARAIGRRSIRSGTRRGRRAGDPAPGAFARRGSRCGPGDRREAMSGAWDRSSSRGLPGEPARRRHRRICWIAASASAGWASTTSGTPRLAIPAFSAAISTSDCPRNCW